jgi:hypothetical protein
MTLLREIQDAAASADTPSAVLLRKCKILSARLDSNDLGGWVDHELSGYPTNDGLPDYRILRNIQSLGNFSGMAGSGLKNAPIPPSCLPDKWQEWASTEYLNSGVSVYEDLLRKESGTFQTPWPADVVAQFGQGIYQYMNCLQAWKVIPRGAIIAITNAIRDRVLGFALAIEKANPKAAESDSGISMSKALVSQVFNTQIYGSVGNIASGNTSVRQVAAIHVGVGDFDALANELAHLGVSVDDITSLRGAVGADQGRGSPRMGELTSGWLGKMISKAASGALKISVTTATNILPKIICSYLGIPIS